MSDIGRFETTTGIELIYSRPNGPSIEVEVEISGILYCDDPEWGIDHEDVTAKVIGRDLTEDEIELLDLGTTLAETFNDTTPVPPKVGERYRCRDGFIWTIKDYLISWENGVDRHILIERPNPSLRLRQERPIRRIIDAGIFAFGVEEDSEGEPLFELVLDEEPKEGNLRPFGITL